MPPSVISRRTLLKNISAIAAFQPFLGGAELFFRKRRFKIGACDWSLGKMCDTAAFNVARQIGLHGVQISLGSEKDDLRLRQKAVQEEFLAASRRSGVRISSLAIGELNNIPYKSDPRTEQWVSDSIDVAKNMGVTVVLLAFFAKNDLRNDPDGKKEVIARLKKVAPKAEKAGITLGLETYLTAEEHLEIMDKVGSKAIKVYYDFRNAADAGNDVFREIKLLGRHNICELHMKENGLLLGMGTMDWPRVEEALNAIDYRGDGWMQIEWAMPKGSDVVESYRHNMGYLKGIFNT